VAPPEIKTEKPSVIFTESLKKEEVKKTVAPPEIRTEKPPVAFSEPLKKEEVKDTVAPPEAPAVRTPQGQGSGPPKAKVPAPVRASAPLQKKTEKRRPVEKPARKATKGKRGKK